MLSASQRRRVDICVAYKARDVTQAQLAKEFGVTVATVNSAIKWGRNSGLYEIDNAQQLEVRIAEVNEEISRLEKMAKVVYENAMEYMKNEKKRRSLITDFVPLIKEIREQRVLLMELQGLYRQNVNIQVEQTNNNILILPKPIDDMDEWMRAVEGIKRNDMATTTEASLSAISDGR
jgi:predicted transcriptional regulator